MEEPFNTTKETEQLQPEKPSMLGRVYNALSGVKDSAGNAYDTAGNAMNRIGASALQGGFAGTLIMMFLTRANLRMAFYGAAMGAVIGAGHAVYKSFKDDGSPGGPPPAPK